MASGDQNQDLMTSQAAPPQTSDATPYLLGSRPWFPALILVRPPALPSARGRHNFQPKASCPSLSRRTDIRLTVLAWPFFRLQSAASVHLAFIRSHLPRRATIQLTFSRAGTSSVTRRLNFRVICLRSDSHVATCDGPGSGACALFPLIPGNNFPGNN